MAHVSTVDLGPRVVARRVTVNAPAAELFAMVNNPRRHGEIDGSGTVMGSVSGPEALSRGAKFTTSMKMYGFPYRITCVVTDHLDTPEKRVVEWAHPAGHRWRWEFLPVDENTTEVTEIFDNRPSKIGKIMEMIGAPKMNQSGITRTLSALADRFNAG